MNWKRMQSRGRNAGFAFPVSAILTPWAALIENLKTADELLG